MENIKIIELYKMLYYMDISISQEYLALHMFWSIPKTSRTIKEYEKLLNLKIYEKNPKNILSSSGKELLLSLEQPYKEIMKIISKDKKIGLDENLILETRNLLKFEILNTKELIHKFNLNELNKIIISEDFEKLIDYKQKEHYCDKDVYYIKHKKNSNEIVIANKGLNPIAEKLKSKNIHINKYLIQSTGICEMVKSKQGVGYTFSTLTLDEKEIDIKKIDELKIRFNIYMN